MRGEALHLPTADYWPLARALRGVAGESEEAVRRTLSAREPENPEEKEIALSHVRALDFTVKFLLLRYNTIRSESEGMVISCGMV